MQVYQHTFIDARGDSRILITPDNPERAAEKYASWVNKLTHVESVATTVEAYYESLIEKHDFYYQYSDDHSVYRAGQNSMDEIRRVGNLLEREDAVRIWNSVIERKGWNEETKQGWYRK